MDKSIMERINKINELYTPERIQKSKERWTCVDKKEKPKDRYPFSLGFPYFNQYNVNHPPRERIEAHIEAFSFMHQFDDDTIPAIFPGLSHASIPSMFGAEEVRCGMETTVKKLIHTIDDIKKLPDPSITPGSAAYKWIEMAEFFKEHTKGAFPVNVCDMQGPFDACAQMWSYDDMFIAAQEEPESYFELLGKITDAFILLWNRQKEIIGNAFVPTHLIGWGWVPNDSRVAVSVDSLVMISPGFYNEFYKPLFRKIFESIGPITIHSCGNFTHLVKELCNTPEIDSINASQLTIKQLAEAGMTSDRTILISVNYDDLENQMEVVRKYHLSPRILVNDVWPTGSGKDQNPFMWTDEDIIEIKNKIERIKNVMTI
jgi:hypothetical protein